MAYQSTVWAWISSKPDFRLRQKGILKRAGAGTRDSPPVIAALARSCPVTLNEPVARSKGCQARIHTFWHVRYPLQPSSRFRAGMPEQARAGVKWPARSARTCSSPPKMPDDITFLCDAEA